MTPFGDPQGDVLACGAVTTSHHYHEPTIFSGLLADALPTADELEKQYVLWMLRHCGGNKTEAVKRLGFDRRTLYRKMARWGIPLTPELTPRVAPAPDAQAPAGEPDASAPSP